MALCAKVVNFVRLDLREEFVQIRRIGQVPMVKRQTFPEVIDALRVEIARATDDAMDFIAFCQQEFGHE